MNRLALSLVLSFTACTHFKAHVPDGFVELPNPEYSGWALRAVTPDGLVLAVRDVDNPDVDGHVNGDAAFWTKAVSNRLRDTGGYALLGQKDVATKSGAKGTRLDYGHDEGLTPHRYTVCVFQAPDRLLLVEAGGEKALFEARQADIDRFIADFEVK